MSLKQSALDKYSIKIAEKGEIFTWLSSYKIKKIEVEEIPMDGRKYECTGTIYLANKNEMQASFRIEKTDDPLLIEDSIYIKMDDVWYKLGEPEFFEQTKLELDDVYPFMWGTDFPIENIGKGPFHMKFKG